MGEAFSFPCSLLLWVLIPSLLLLSLNVIKLSLLFFHVVTCENVHRLRFFGSCFVTECDIVHFFSGMIMGASTASVWYNLRVPHPTKEVPIIDYDLGLIFQPMLMLGITVGVALSVVFPYWLITVLIIILFIGLSLMSFILAEKFTYKTNPALDESVLRWSLLINGEKCSFTF